MEQITLTGQQEYEGFKQELEQRLHETSENFIVIGYILKQVKDKQLYRNEAYKDIYEFGFGAFGLSRSTVSRFMGINTRFSVGGNSRELKPEYKGYGSSKLQEMLNMDEGDMELVYADTPVEHVQELKKAEKVQRQLEKEDRENSLPLMQMAAAGDADSVEAEPVDPFDMVMTAFWQENMDLYHRVAAGFITPETAAEEICPSGSRTFRCGVNMMFFYNFVRGTKLRSYGNGKASITPYTYQEIIEKTLNFVITPGEQVPETPGNSSGAAATSESGTGTAEKTVATPQPEEQTVPCVQVPGQVTVDELQGTMPDVTKNPAATEETDGTSGPAKDDDVQDAGTQDNVIDGEYRELEGKTAAAQPEPEAPVSEAPEPKPETQCPYTDIEIRNAISYFDLEYSRMVGLGQNTAKRRNYKMALECIRKCYKTAAEKWDMEAYQLTGV